MPNYTNHPTLLSPAQIKQAVDIYYAQYPHPEYGPVRPTIMRLAQHYGVAYHTMWRTLARNNPRYTQQEQTV